MTSTFSFNGEAVSFTPGQSIGAALWAAGLRELRRTRDGSPRGMFCAMGLCHDCHVVVDTHGDQRACVTQARAGMRVTSQDGAAAPPPPRADNRVQASERIRADVVIVGAGPAGLSAAVAAAARGARVVVVDAAARIGGQYWRHGPHGVGPRHHEIARWHELSDAVAIAQAQGHIDIRLRHSVWRVDPGAGTRAQPHVVRAVVGVDPGSPDAVQRPVIFEAPALVIATGAHDRVLPIPGWDLPGVLTPGAAQVMLKEHEVLAGRRVVVAGTGPFLMALAAELAEAGAEVSELVEASNGSGWLSHWRTVLDNRDTLRQFAGLVATLARQRVPVRAREVVVAAHGRGRLEAVTVMRLDSSGQVIAGSARWVPCDTLAIGWGFTPRLDLARQAGCTLAERRGDVPVGIAADPHGRAGAPGVMVAGEVRGIGGVRLALLSGEAAGASAAAWSQGLSAVADGDYLTQLRRLNGFAQVLASAHSVPAGWSAAIDSDSLICRCESVDGDTLRSCVTELGAQDLRTAKLLSRCGMGWCQGRICGEGVARLVAAHTGADSTQGYSPDTRPVAEPLTLASLLKPAQELIGEPGVIDLAAAEAAASPERSGPTTPTEPTDPDQH